jgi:hypothetical protein
VLPVVRIEDLADFDESVNILLIGDSGTGKTVTAASAPRATFLSTEAGAVSAKVVGSNAGIMRTPTWAHVLSGLETADRDLGKGDWLIPDSISKMQILMLRDILGLAHDENESRSLDIPAIQDHQEWQNKFKRFIDRMIEAPYNTIMVAQTMEHEDAEGEDWTWPALLGGRGKAHEVAAYVMAQFDVCLHLAAIPQENKDTPTRRRLTTEIVPPIWAKDRFQALPRYINVKDGDYRVMERIIKAIEEKRAPQK